MKNLSLLLLLFFSTLLNAQDPQSDCSNAILLCNNNLVEIDAFQGKGKIAAEVGSNNCTGLPFPEENGVWLKWQIVESGELAFNITPLNANDDIDFVLFELPQGYSNCGSKKAVRCVASGANLGVNPSAYKACTGATGLRAAEPDLSEVRGCFTDDNNFVRSTYANAGDYYALFINNYGSDEGAILEFTGSAQLGGEVYNEIMAQQTTDQNNSTFSFEHSGEVSITGTAFDWYFGPDAQPASANGAGPHSVVFTQDGEHLIEETIHTEYGCSFIIQKTVQVSGTSIQAIGTGSELVIGEIFPNPINGPKVYIPVYSPVEQEIRLSLNNYLGQNLGQQVITLIKGNQNVPISIEGLAVGTQLIASFEIDGKVYARKAVHLMDRP